MKISLQIDVTENLKWFKEMQDLQTDTTKSSISQVENMKAHGRFIVGCSQKRTKLSDFFEEVIIYFYTVVFVIVNLALYNPPSLNFCKIWLVCEMTLKFPKFFGFRLSSIQLNYWKVQLVAMNF
jgi:hypothetical protein